jgi:hypothetical protein
MEPAGEGRTGQAEKGRSIFEATPINADKNEIALLGSPSILVVMGSLGTVKKAHDIIRKCVFIRF